MPVFMACSAIVNLKHSFEDENFKMHFKMQIQVNLEIRTVISRELNLLFTYKKYNKIQIELYKISKKLILDTPPLWL